MSHATTMCFNLTWITDLHVLYNANPYSSSIIRQNSIFRHQDDCLFLQWTLRLPFYAACRAMIQFNLLTCKDGAACWRRSAVDLRLLLWLLRWHRAPPSPPPPPVPSVQPMLIFSLPPPGPNIRPGLLLCPTLWNAPPTDSRDSLTHSPPSNKALKSRLFNVAYKYPAHPFPSLSPLALSLLLSLLCKPCLCLRSLVKHLRAP